MRKWYLLSLLALLLPAALWAAGSGEKTTAAGASAKPVVVFFWDDRDSAPADLERVRQYVIKQSGVNFTLRKVKTGEEFSNQLAIALAGKEDIDLIPLDDTNQMIDFKTRGAIKTITQEVNTYAPDLKKNIPADAWKIVTDGKGDIWAIPVQSFQNQGRVLQIRKDWREKLGLPPIQTLADFENYLRAVKTADLDGNGKGDTIPLINTDEGYFGYEAALLYLFTETVPDPSNDATSNYIDSKGNVTPVPLHPGFKDYLRKMAQWNKDGLIYPESYSIKANAIGDLIAANRVGATSGWYSSTYRPWQTLLKTVPTAAYEFVLPQTLSGKPYLVKKDNPGSPQLAVVSFSPVAAQAVKLVDWFGTSKENYITMKAGVRGTDWDWVDQNATTIKYLVDKTDPSKSYNYGFSFFFNGPWNPKPANPKWLDQQYAAGNKIIDALPPLWNPDWFVPYDFKGTPIANGFADAQTLLSEAEVNIILGKRPVDDWDQVIAQYRKTFADQYIQLATAQYNQFKK
jgi:putative aldouronate transport system substrate-binding protein